MPTFPHGLCAIRFGDHAERESSMYLRSEVERGIPRQRRFQADSLVAVPCTLLFKSRSDEQAWRVWFASEGGDFFSFTLPRTGQPVQARVAGGNLGTLKPRSPDWEWSERSIELEYVRPGFRTLPPGLHSVTPAQVMQVQRASTATFVDAAGVLQTAAANVARFQGGQLLVEAAATNLAAQSQALNQAPWGGDASAVIAAESFRGAAPFWTLAKTVSSGSEQKGQVFGAVSAGQTFSLVLALLSGSATVVSAGLFDGVSWGLAADSTAEVLEGPGEASRSAGALFEVAGLHASVPTLLRVTRTFLVASPIGYVLLYPGGAMSTTIGHSVKVTRVQVEAGPVVTSYIPTTTAPATRAADVIQVTA